MYKYIFERHLSVSLLSAMFNRTSCAQVHELPQSHCGDNRKGTLLSRFHDFVSWYHEYMRVCLCVSVCVCVMTM